MNEKLFPKDQPNPLVEDLLEKLGEKLYELTQRAYEVITHVVDESVWFVMPYMAWLDAVVVVVLIGLGFKPQEIETGVADGILMVTVPVREIAG